MTDQAREQQPFGWIGRDGKFSLPGGMTRERFLSHFRDNDPPVGTPVIPLYTSPPPAPGWDEATRYLQKIADLVDDENACEPLDDAISYANKALEALRCEAPATSGVADTTWFWEIVDREGLENVPSDERGALSRIMNELRTLRATRPDVGGGVRDALEDLIGSSEAFLNYFSPFNLSSDKENQWLSTYDDIVRARAALSNPPAAVESNASAEARLREALTYARTCIWSGCDTIEALKIIDKALSAVGDEAKKSEGGGESGPAFSGTGGRAPRVEQTTPATMPAQAGVAPGPSGPSPDVTMEELADFLYDNGSLVTGDDGEEGLAALFNDAFTVGRR